MLRRVVTRDTSQDTGRAWRHRDRPFWKPSHDQSVYLNPAHLTELDQLDSNRTCSCTNGTKRFKNEHVITFYSYWLILSRVISFLFYKGWGIDCVKNTSDLNEEWCTKMDINWLTCMLCSKPSFSKVDSLLKCNEIVKKEISLTSSNI